MDGQGGDDCLGDGSRDSKKRILTKLLNMLHCLDERHSKECSITLKINRQNKIYLPESQERTTLLWDSVFKFNLFSDGRLISI